MGRRSVIAYITRRGGDSVKVFKNLLLALYSTSAVIFCFSYVALGQATPSFEQCDREYGACLAGRPPHPRNPTPDYCNNVKTRCLLEQCQRIAEPEARQKCVASFTPPPQIPKDSGPTIGAGPGYGPGGGIDCRQVPRPNINSCCINQCARVLPICAATWGKPSGMIIGAVDLTLQILNPEGPGTSETFDTCMGCVRDCSQNAYHPGF